MEPHTACSLQATFHPETVIPTQLAFRKFLLSNFIVIAAYITLTALVKIKIVLVIKYLYTIYKYILLVHKCT